jgi:hypothetical protein
LYDSSLDCGYSENLAPISSQHYSATANPVDCLTIGVPITSMEIDADDPNESPDFYLYLYSDENCATLKATGQGGGDECFPAESSFMSVYLFFLSD